MRIAVPVSGDCLEQHFGHCEKFLLIDIASETKEVTGSTEITAPEHQPGLLPRWLKEHNVTLVIAGGMGAHARSLLQEASIEAVTGAPPENAMVLVQRYLDGTLTLEDCLCDHVCNH